MADQRKPVVAVTMGDPCGIGPEVIAKALASPDVYENCRPLIIGNGWCMERALELVGSDLKLHQTTTPLESNGVAGTVELLDPGNLNVEDVTVGQISPVCGKAAMEWVASAGKLAMTGEVDAIATAPVNKEAASLGGYSAIGHTELFQEMAGSPTVATMLMSGSLRVVHLTTHRSLRRALDYVTKDRILSFLQLTHETFGRWGMPNPRIGVAALNPHGSDGGLLGPEEGEEIGPAVEAAKAAGVNATGPVPADSVFHQAISGRYDVVLAMFHDQGHIPVKVHGFERSITANLGLPFIRTSVDHGTAFDIAGQGVADHLSMIEAIKLAQTFARGQGLSE
jgi:4-hydroxythreonine-4-phosphate dehydrogenase